MPAGVDLAGFHEERNADVVKFAVGEGGAEVAYAAVARADEDLEPSLRGHRIAAGRLTIATRERVAELVEGRAAARQPLEESGHGFPDVHEHLLIVLAHRGETTVRFGVQARQRGIAGNEPGDQAPARPQLARVDGGPDHLRPQTVGAAVPREPALPGHVENRRRIALERNEADRLLPAVGPCARRIVTGRAGQSSSDGEARIEEQALAKRDGGGIAGGAIARIA